MMVKMVDDDVEYDDDDGDEDDDDDVEYDDDDGDDDNMASNQSGW